MSSTDRRRSGGRRRSSRGRRRRSSSSSSSRAGSRSLSPRRGTFKMISHKQLDVKKNIAISDKPDDFEIHKTENSIQKKRQYRTNKDSSQSESPDRQLATKSRDGASRRGNRRSNSRSRVRGNRSRSRNRSRTPRQRSRSPRRDNNWER